MAVIDELVFVIRAKGAEETEQKTKEVKRDFGELKKYAEGAAKAITVAAAASAAAVAGAVNSLAKQATEIKTSAAAIALSNKQLQEWRFIAQASGVDAGNFADGLRQMSSQLRASAVAGGKGEAATAIKQIGLDFQAFIKLSPDEQLKILADEFAKTGRSASKNAAFMRLFGEESGSKFAEMLEGGSAAIEKQRKRAHELGAVLGEDTLDAADAVAEQMRELGVVFQASTNTLASAFLPSALKVAKALTEWIAKNREMLGQKVQEWVDKFGRAAEKAAPALLAIAEATGKVAAAMADFVAEYPTAVIGLTALSAGFLALQGPIGQATLALTGYIAALSVANKIGNDLESSISGQEVVKADLQTTIDRAEFLGSTGVLSNEGRIREGLSKLSDENLQGFIDSGLTSSDPRRARLAQIGDRIRKERLVRKAKEEVAASNQIAAERDRLRADLGQFQTAQGTSEIKPAEISAIAELADKRIISRSAERAILEPRTRQLSEGRTAVEERPITAKELKKLLAQGEISRQDFDVLRGATSFFSPDKSAVGDAELLKLIKAAAQSGQNLDTLLGGRKIEGGTPPVITVTVTNNNVTVDAQVNVSSTAASAMDVASSVVTQFETRLGTVISKYMPTPQVAR